VHEASRHTVYAGRAGATVHHRLDRFHSHQQTKRARWVFPVIRVPKDELRDEDGEGRAIRWTQFREAPHETPPAFGAGAGAVSPRGARLPLSVPGRVIYPPGMDLAPGTTVGEYLLLKLLGRGGQGSVWKADRKGASYALKFFDLKLLSARHAERARREARAVRALDHPAIVKCLDEFEWTDRGIVLVFEFVDGAPLASLASDGPIEPRYRDAILAQLASALAHAHAHGIAHRDVKPANVLVADSFWRAPHAPSGVKLVDFGIAAGIPDTRPLTRTDQPAPGTAPYMAPEVLLRGRFAPLPQGFTRDVFSFGVMAWQLMSGGAHPTGLGWDATRPELASAYRAADEGRRPWPPPEIALHAPPLVSACLALDPGHRPANGAALVAGLADVHEARASRPSPARAGDVTTEPPDAPPRTSRPETTRDMAAITAPAASTVPPISVLVPAPPVRARRRRPSKGVYVAVASAAAVAAVGLAAVYMAASSEDERGPPPPAPRPSPTAVVTAREPRGEAPDPPTPTPCCGESGRCVSGRPCAPGACTEHLRERWWLLRITHATQRDSHNVYLEHPNAHVFVWRRDDPGRVIDVPLTRLHSSVDGDWDDRLRVRTSDLERGALRIRIGEPDADAPYYEDWSASNADGIRATALCSGVKLWVGPKDRAPAIVYGFLDDG